jgi:nickel/cobalt transporter (NicO) family protein
MGDRLRYEDPTPSIDHQRGPSIRQLVSIVVILWLGCGGALAWAQNPFTGKSPSREAPSHPSVGSGPLEKIALWQFKIREHMAGRIEEAREQVSIRPLLVLVLLGMGYGILHAAGPGHGKAVALSYMLTRRATTADAVLFGNLVSFFHGLSGILFVLVVKLLLSGSVGRTLEDVTRVTQIVSFSIIFCLGSIICIQGLRSLWKQERLSTTRDKGFFKRQKGPVAAAAVVGVVPCPGVVMVMLFCLSLELLWFGILLGVAITAGMALTITLAVLIGVAGKRITMSAVKPKHSFEHVVRSVAGLMVAILGGVLLASAITIQ